MTVEAELVTSINACRSLVQLRQALLSVLALTQAGRDGLYAPVEHEFWPEAGVFVDRDDILFALRQVLLED